MSEIHHETCEDSTPENTTMMEFYDIKECTQERDAIKIALRETISTKITDLHNQIFWGFDAEMLAKMPPRYRIGIYQLAHPELYPNSNQSNEEVAS